MRIRIRLGKDARKILRELSTGDAKQAMKMLFEGTDTKINAEYDLNEAEIATLVEKISKNLREINPECWNKTKGRLRVVYRRQFGIISIESY